MNTTFIGLPDKTHRPLIPDIILPDKGPDPQTCFITTARWTAKRRDLDIRS